MEINLRVYGLAIRNNHVLVSKEYIANKWLIKFPGGGVNPQESLTDALCREFREEVQCTVSESQHFYTTDAYVPSWFDSKQRVLSVYFTISLLELQPHNALVLPKRSEHEVYWAPISMATLNSIDLPIERTVFKLLLDMC
jgi:ADP-ribose pyrophosphatase YjhB (NUDIX family)